MTPAWLQGADDLASGASAKLGRFLTRPWGACLVAASLVLLMLWRTGLAFFLTSPAHGYQLSTGKQILLGRFPFVRTGRERLRSSGSRHPASGTRPTCQCANSPGSRPATRPSQ